ncbi:hypothetical protein I6H88_06580 [Elizabethkingia bruuniana]|uniref:Uncharacterized protein n=1 Tax=Elizabethkingia bruuniana TaxID=1756149 RepID=A0A5E8D1U1_9FLAO|nr:hypothetical protein [Elizabethkingia bruuniana]KGO11981.1 hypothetical protein KS04_00895 [Elizabethkingia miricola]MDV3604156.1 hypothetical protein [Elizabethkingia anophelis]AQX86125.1 hypothetical protein AYC65_14420 [Elizabethkingia bruuniana]AQX86517.1 hypothetical protein AYC65_16575 [Elizabethkingia bruuniana]KUY27264.1 hypothetical protein ATB97_19330 [Elizabethkingia bruuniana]
MEILLIISNTASSISQTSFESQKKKLAISIEQKGILLPPEQYEEVWKKIKEIEKTINPNEH